MRNLRRKVPGVVAVAVMIWAAPVAAEPRDQEHSYLPSEVSKPHNLRHKFFGEGAEEVVRHHAHKRRARHRRHERARSRHESRVVSRHHRHRFVRGDSMPEDLVLFLPRLLFGILR